MSQPPENTDSTKEIPFWGHALLSGNIAEWHRKARTKQLRWQIFIYLTQALKRCLDVVGSIFALILISPILLLTYIAIKLDDGGPVLFKQIRVGEEGKLFLIWKFRSMVMNADKIKNEILKQNQHADGITWMNVMKIHKTF